MNDVMMQLGNFQFKAPEAAYQKISRASRFQWASISQLGREPVKQYTGTDQELTLTGLILPQLGGGSESIASLRIMGGMGDPYQLVDGRGSIHGFWCITQVDEERGTFAAQGMPRRITFSLSLSFYGLEFSPNG